MTKTVLSDGGEIFAIAAAAELSTKKEASPAPVKFASQPSMGSNLRSLVFDTRQFRTPRLWQFGNVTIESGFIEANWTATRRSTADCVSDVS